MHTIMNSPVAHNQSRVEALNDRMLKNDLVVQHTANTNGVLIELLYANYMAWDRSPRTGKWASVSDIRDWALHHHLPTDNATINLIRRMVWYDGHAGQPLVALLEKELNHRWQHVWADQIMEVLMAQLHNVFV
jgi:hypothetical protein